MGQSGNQGFGAGLDVDDVYSTFVYTGTAGASTAAVVTNGIDLSGEGGLVWTKQRNGTEIHYLTDTERGGTKFLRSNGNNAQGTQPAITFNSDGFSQAFYPDTMDVVSWTFRKAPKFFDVVTYTGNETVRTISHNLGSTPGMIIVKRTDSSGHWYVFHKDASENGSTPGHNNYLRLNTTGKATDSSVYWNDTAPTNTVFTIGDSVVINANGGTFVAYLFAHNDGDGEFGPSGDQDIIKCGSYTGAGSTDVDVNIGFEPQWLMIKKSSTAGSNWVMVDNVRGVVTGGDDAHILANLANSEDNSSDFLEFTPTGFRITGTSGNVATNNDTYVFTAIRRGPLAAPTSSSQVFEVDNAGSTGDGAAPKFRSGFTVDFALRKDTGSGNWEALTRLLQGTSLRPNDVNAEDSGSGGDQFDYMNGYNTGTNTDSSLYSWMWKRAPKYFDVVTYTGTSGAQTITHNLGVVPEMIWIKKRSEDSFYGFTVYHGTTGNMMLANDFSSGFGSSNAVNHSNISATTFQVPSGNIDVNDNGETHVAYLFASVAGVSKIGSVAHSGSSTDVDCGFSNGSKFVLLKRTDATGNWRLFDSDRGIVSGNDPHVFINLSSAQNTSTDLIDPLSSGFQITDDLTDGTYLFYAIAA